MHYLEDAGELLEHLPEELRKKCREIQQLDAQSTVEMTKLLKDSGHFFCTLNELGPFESEQHNVEFHEKFRTVHDIGKAKVQAAEYVQLMLEKYQEKVAKDLCEFKAELEVDNPGETELIERNFMHTVASIPSASAFDLSEHYSRTSGDGIEQLQSMVAPSASTAMELAEFVAESPNFRQNGNKPAFEEELGATPKQRGSRQHFDEFRIPANLRRPSLLDPCSPLPSLPSSSSSLGYEDIFDAELVPPAKKLKPTPLPRFLAQIGTGDLQQTEPQQREDSSTTTSTSSVPSTSTKINELDGGGDFIVPPQTPPHHSRHPSIVRMPLLAGSQASRHGRQRKLTKKVEQMLMTGNAAPSGGGRTSSRANSLTRARHIGAKRRRRRKAMVCGEEGAVEEEVDESVEDEDSYQGEMEDEEEREEGDEEEVDDNKTWCVCKQRSHGKMVACDNKNCLFEWFHYECVGITQEPKGEWYCPTCKMQRNRPTSSDSVQ